MPLSKLKNLALLVLLLANLVLLGLLFPEKAAARREDAAMRQSLSDLYAGQQVTLNPEIIPDTVTLYMLELAENPDANLQAASALLGETILVQDDSTRYLSTYESKSGQCSIGRNGSFQAELTGSQPVKDLRKHTEKLLQDMGFQTLYLSDPVRLRAGVFSLTASQTVLGVPLFSEGLTMTYGNNCLTDLNGVFYTGANTLTRISDSACLSAADALVSFLSARFDLGWVGSAVTDMEQGYLRSETAAAAAVHLTPVWKLTTDTGSFYVDGISGEITAADA